MKRKSFIKSPRYYKEAEDLQEGWGKTLTRIDTLKEKVYNNSDISLDDACWILYGEGHCFSTWDGFLKYAKSMGWGENKIPWTAWEGLFRHYQKNL